MAAHMKKTEWDNIPEWAIYALEYGTEEDGSLNENERAMIEKFVGTHFPKGYTMSVDWDACNEFDRYPAFEEPCKTCKVLFVINTQKNEKNDTERISRCPRKLSGSMDYRTMGYSRLGKLEKKPHGTTYPDGI